MGRVAVVTGGSRGIGAAISKELAKAGYKVSANYAGNDEAAAKFKEETGIPVYKWDVSNYEACVAGLKQVEADLGPVEVLAQAVETAPQQALHRHGAHVHLLPQPAIAPPRQHHLLHHQPFPGLQQGQHRCQRRAG